jgi:hypothetical protein
MTRNTKKSILAVGYLCLAAAAVVAHQSPATQYELSLYAGTPLLVWVFLAGAYVVSLTLGTMGSDRIQDVALILGTAATVLLVGLPLARGYRFLGAGDSLTHLGWAKSIAAGSLSPMELLYPAIHTSSVAIGEVTGVTLERGFLLVTVLFTLVYLLFVPAVVRRIVTTRWSLAVATVSGWLLLPINDISVYLMPFPTMQAISFAPLVLFGMVLYMERNENAKPRVFGRSSSTLLFLLLGVVLLLVHPQQMVNLVLLLFAVAGTQLLFRRYEPDHVIANHRSVLAPAVVLAGLLAVWMQTHPRTGSALSGAVNALYEFSFGGTTQTVAQRGVSLAELGSGLLPIFLKLFAVSAVYMLLSASAIAGVWLFRSVSQRTESAIAYLSAAVIPLTVLFGVYFVATPTMAFRQLGFGMVVATILGAIELSRLFKNAEHELPAPRVQTVAAGVLAVLVLFAAVTVFPSPYVLKTSGHVTDQQLDGHQAVFEYQTEPSTVVGVRGGPERYAHAVNGLDDPVNLNVESVGGEVPEESFVAGNLSTVYEEDTYVVVTQADYERETKLYRGFRYPERGFERLDQQPGVNKVVDNGGLRLYQINETA